jgi:hypothetical protein
MRLDRMRPVTKTGSFRTGGGDLGGESGGKLVRESGGGPAYELALGNSLRLGGCSADLGAPAENPMASRKH